MASQGPMDPLPELLAKSQQTLTQLDSLHQEVTQGLSSLLADVKKDAAGLQSAISDQIKNQAESKVWKVLFLVIPVLLTVVLGFFVDASGKKLAARLAVSQEFYKKKLLVYDEADKQMAAVVGCLEDLRVNQSDSAQTTAAFDNIRKLSEMTKTNTLYMSKEVSEGLNDVSVTIAASAPLNGKPGNNLETIRDEVDRVEAQMKKELEGFGSLD